MKKRIIQKIFNLKKKFIFETKKLSVTKDTERPQSYRSESSSVGNFKAQPPTVFGIFSKTYTHDSIPVKIKQHLCRIITSLSLGSVVF